LAFATKRFLGQGATEYLVLLAVVLIIALVSIALLGFFPGMASDAKTTQSQSYWQSASPIAVIDGAGYISANGNPDVTNALMLVLRNNGANTVELLAISDGRFGGQSSDPSDWDNNRINWEYFTGEYYDGFFSNYVGAPRGTGFTAYSQTVTMAPGETVTVGFSVYNGGSGGQPYNVRVCKQFGQSMVKQMEVSDLTFFYRPIIDGRTGIEKKQYGSKPLVVPCIDSDLT